MSPAKIGRNDPCPCGGGKKFKRCHGVAGFNALATPQRAALPGSHPQLNALQEIERFAADPASPIIRAETLGFDDEGTLGIRLTFNTAELEVHEGGLPLVGSEEIIIPVPLHFPWTIRFPLVDHDRFVGQPHVLLGRILCIYLDPSQEWHPSLGIGDYLDRLWAWLSDAAAAKFDAAAALFHPVGGVPYATPGSPTIVVRDSLDIGSQPYRKKWLRERSPARLDLIREPHELDLEVPVVVLPGSLSFGAGATLADLRDNLDRLMKGSSRDALRHVDDTIRRNPGGSPQYFLLAIPRPKATEPEDVHLIAGRIPAVNADKVRASGLKRNPMDALGENTPIDWCPVSEERRARTMRRDVQRPVGAFKDKTIVLWGCGGLGSWIGEFLARAGARKIVLSDPGRVMGGLLVRQDYGEGDVGDGKAHALKRRLDAINDATEVIVDERGYTEVVVSGYLPDCDVLIDATINTAVGAAIKAVWPTSRKRPLVARICTDRATSTLGLMTISSPCTGPDLDDLDERAGKTVQNDADLEPFRCFWEEPNQGDEVVPEPGCSVPTFHGSAADLAAIAGVLTSLLGRHVGIDNPGTHLVGLPHGPGASIPHCWIADET